MTVARTTTALSLLALAACGGHELAAGACHDDGDCAAGSVCVATACVAMAPPGPTYALELTPAKDPAAEGAPAYTELLGAALDGSARTLLTLETASRITGSIQLASSSATAAALQSARIVVAVDSLVEPDTDVTFEADARASANVVGGALGFALIAPASAVARRATIWAHPTSPSDEQVPPWTVAVPALGSTLALTSPGPTDVFVFEGRLEDALGHGARNYRARALLAGRVISNEAMTSADGGFRVLVPKSSIAASEGAPAVTIELVPNDAAAPLPRLTLSGVAPGDPKLAALKLPAFAAPETFRFPVTGGGKPIAGATVRLRTVVATAAGEAQLQRDSETDAAGLAEVMLVPGTTEMARMYSVVVIPPASVKFEPRCVPAYPIVASGSAAPRTVAALELSPKVEVKGQLTDAEGHVASGVSVTATVAAGLPAAACGTDVPTPPATAVTDADGNFKLPLARGTYAFEYAPTAGSALPLLRASNITIDQDITTPVRLPVGQVVTGLVVDGAGKPASGVDVRLFRQSTPPTATPTLVGRALSAANGAFRVVVQAGP